MSIDEASQRPSLQPRFPSLRHPGWMYGLVLFGMIVLWICRATHNTASPFPAPTMASLLEGIGVNLPWLLALSLLPVLGRSVIFRLGLVMVVGASVALGLGDAIVWASRPHVFSPAWEPFTWLCAVVGLAGLSLAVHLGSAWFESGGLRKTDTKHALDGEACAKTKSRWMYGYFLLGGLLAPYGAVAYAAILDWRRFGSETDSPLSWWLGVGFYLVLTALPYIAAWSIHFAFRKSVIYRVGVLVFVVASAIFYAIIAHAAGNSRHGGLLLIVIPCLQAAGLILLTLISLVERWAGARGN